VLDAICGHAPSSIGGAYGALSLAAQRKVFERFPRFEIGDGSVRVLDAQAGQT
jgi:hypothetical protein